MTDEYVTIKGLSPEDVAALEAECSALRPECVKWLVRRCGIPMDQAEDAFQSAYLRAVLAIRRGLFHGDSSVKTWFFRIADREMLERARSAAARLVVSIDAARDGDVRAPRSRDDEANPSFEPRLGPDSWLQIQKIPMPYSALLAAERETGLSQASARLLRSLSGKLRPVVEKFYLRGERCDEIARELDIPNGTVLTRLHQARKTLRRRFTRNNKHPRSIDAMIRNVIPAVAAIVVFASAPLFASTWGRPEPDGSVRLLEVSGAAREAQEDVAAASGFVPVEDAAPRPADSAFAVHVPTYSAATNGGGAVIGLVRDWRAVPIQIRLDRGRLLDWAAGSGAWSNLAGAVRADAALRAWWTDDLTYVRGSANALRAAAAFGLDEAAIEAIVLECRAAP